MFESDAYDVCWLHPASLQPWPMESCVHFSCKNNDDRLKVVAGKTGVQKNSELSH